MAAADPFNTLGGFSVGIPPELVIDSTGNVVNNVNAPNSNVTANRVFANAYLYANGDPLSIGAAGSNTQVQYNNNGLLGASSAFTFNSATNLLTVTKLQVGTNANLGNVSNVVILGGTNGYFLQTDGAGNLTWAPAGNGGNTGNGIPGGANTQVQFNDAGQFGGDAGFTYNKVSNTLSIANTIAAGNAITGVNLSVTDATIYNTLSVTDVIASNITLSANVTSANWINANYFAGNGHNLFGLVGANVTGQVGFANVANNVAGANVSGTVGFANVANSVAGANVTGQVANALVAGTVYTNAQPNITSVGNLTSLTVVGNTTLGNQVVSNYFIGNLFGVANLARNVTLSAQPNITSVGTLTSLAVSGNITSGNVNAGNTLTANYIVGTINTGNQPNITSIGNLTTLNVSGNTRVGNLFANSGIVVGSSLVGLVSTPNQTSITGLGTLNALNVNGVSNLGLVGNVKILGGTNGYVLSTDGTGNLSWIVQGNGGGGNGTPAGSNTQLQYNNAGSFGASPKLTWNDTTDFLLVGGNATFSNGTVNAARFVSNTFSSNSATVSGNLTAGNINAGNLLTANYISGTLTTNAQANINYLGNVGWLNVDTSIPNANGNITFNGSMSGIGAYSNIVITGNLNAGNYVQANYLVGIITTSSQPNITSLGNLTSLTVTGNSNLGNVANITIDGGSPNYVLSTDGAGNLSWVAQTGGNGGGTPGGNTTQIQYNDNGSFAGSPNLTWNNSTQNANIGGNLNVNGNVNAKTFVSNNATGLAPLIVNSTTPVANLGVQTAATVRDNAQPNITSVGTLTSLDVSGNISGANLSLTNTFSAPNISVSGLIGTTNLNVTGTATFSNSAVVSGSGTLTINGKLNAAGASNVTLGNVSNVKITGGINGYVLTTDGSGNLSWSAGGSGGNGTPGGSNTQIQYNNAGAFGGSPLFTFDAANANVKLAGNLQANTFTMGSGAFEFSHSNVYFAITNDTSEQVILSIDADNMAAVDYTIISTDGSIRNYVKISAVINGSSLNYVEYSTLPVNGYVGDFSVIYNAGNIVSAPSIDLKMTPQSANAMTHKMMITTYKV